MFDIGEYGTAFVSVAIIAIVLASFGGVVADVGDTLVEDDPLVVQGGEAALDVGIGQTIRSHNGTTATLDTAVKFDGSADSELSTTGDVGVTVQSDAWSVCTYARPGAGADNTTSTVLKYERAAIIHNGTSDTYRGYFFDLGNRSAVDAAVPVNGTSDRKLVCLQRSGDTVTLSRNTSASASVTLNTDSGVTPPPDTGFAGVVEETRIYGTALSTSQKDAWLQEPSLAIESAPQPGLRLMYDANSGTTFPAFFAGTLTTAQSATLVDGADTPPIARGTDYEWRGTFGQRLATTSTTLADDNEIVYASYVVSAGGYLDRLWSASEGALGLLLVGVAAIGVLRLWDEF